MFHVPRMITPSLGLPSFISRNDEVLRVEVLSPGGALDRSVLKGSFSLSPVGSSFPAWPLPTLKVSELPPAEIGGPLRKALGSPGRYSVIEILLSLNPRPAWMEESRRRFLLFNLVHPRIEGGSHSAAVLLHDWENCRFCFMTDIHVARMWDRIQDGFVKLDEGDRGPAAEDLFSPLRAFSRRAFEDNFINPNRNFVHFIRTANDLASRGELDFIIAGGDLVDYQRNEPEEEQGAAFAATNLELFEKIVTGAYSPGIELEVPLLTVPGNHDYRVHPYQVHHYGLERCGLHDRQTGYFIRKSWGGRKKWLSFKDLRAVLSRPGGRHPLGEYLTHINSKTDYSLAFGKTKFIFLDTGKDVFRNFGRIHFRRWPNLAKAALRSWHFPGSAGLSRDQVDFLARELPAGAPNRAVLVFHAGLINTHFDGRAARGNFRHKDPGPIKLGGPDEYRFPFLVNDRPAITNGLKKAVRFENKLEKLRLNYGGLFQNQLALFELACRPELRLLGLSGHFHRSMEIKIDKAEGTAWNKNYAADGIDMPDGNRVSYFFGSGALGHSHSRYAVPNRPGYYLVEFSGGGGTSVRKLGLNAGPLDEMNFFAAVAAGSPGSARIETTAELISDDLRGREKEVRSVITLIVSSGKMSGGQEGPPFEIEAFPREAVLSGRTGWVGEADREDYFDTKARLFYQSFRCAWIPRLEFVVRPRTEFPKACEVMVTAEYFLEEGTGVRPVRMCTHPSAISWRLNGGGVKA